MLFPGWIWVLMASAVMGQDQKAVPPIVPQTVGPYLQNPSPEAMTLCFAAQKAEKVIVRWAAKGAQSMTTTSAVATTIPGTPWTIWKTRLTGLKPGTAYQYELNYEQDSRNQKEPVHVFKTVNPKAASITMAAYNDLHSNVQTLKLLTKQLTPEDYDFSALLGDCWSDPSMNEVFIVLDQYVRLLNASEKPMIFVRGNHEFRGSFKQQMAYLFDLPNLDNPGAQPNEQKYQFDMQIGPVWFIAMDCGEDGDRDPPYFNPYREMQMNWLKGRLADKAKDQKSWRVLLSHLPLYQNDFNCYSEASRKIWEPALANAGIDLQMSGHSHSFGLIPKGKDITISLPIWSGDGKDRQQTGTNTWQIIPPFPVMTGGGPSAREGTVMLLHATAADLKVRMLNTASIRLDQKE
jgi:predicted MPP superfamily phosphohydrolase